VRASASRDEAMLMFSKARLELRTKLSQASSMALGSLIGGRSLRSIRSLSSAVSTTVSPDGAEIRTREALVSGIRFSWNVATSMMISSLLGSLGSCTFSLSVSPDEMIWLSSSRLSLRACTRFERISFSTSAPMMRITSPARLEARISRAIGDHSSGRGR
jgi:hypothetical protein